MKRILLIGLVTCWLPGCNPDLDSECHHSGECPADLYCRMGTCTDLDEETAGGLLGGDEATADAGTTSDAATHPCPDAPSADAGDLVLNEFMVNVPQGDDGDANDDGTRHYDDDEFVELVNTGEQTIDLTSVTVQNGDDVRFAFGPGCLEPLNAAIVFGGLESGAQLPGGDNWESFVADSRFRYAQDGGRVVVRDAEGDAIADVSYGSSPAGSLNRSADLDGPEFVAHNDVDDSDALFSPGRCADGRSFSTGCVETENTSDNAKTVPDDD